MGNVQVNWPKLSLNHPTSAHVKKVCILVQIVTFREHFERDKITKPGRDM